MATLFGKHYFPLINLNSRFKQYFVGADLAIYSTRKGGPSTEPVKLEGSKTHQYSTRYVTLDGAAYDYDKIVRRAHEHPAFFKETQTGSYATDVKTVTVSSVTENRTKSATAMLKSKGYMLATIGDGDVLEFGKSPMFHTTMATARAEAERISRDSGKQVVVLQAIGAVKVGAVVWE